ncbi:MAG: HlyD family efflux transporter periplasmic adaptor subunit [Bacteroidetes bacterium]|nr:MAG: HlyD family efflux transporter periplasmic adaptor subunit [Bacteroidota bacterium]
MKDRKPEIKYSDPVKEIMGNPPGKILRWGTLVLFTVFILFVLFAWLIRYPDTIPSPVEITTMNPPVTLTTKITGRIKNLYVKEKDKVTAGQLLAVMETTASMKEIGILNQIIDSIKNPESFSPESLPELSELGEIQSYYGVFLKCLSDLNNYTKNDFYGSKIISVTEEINGILEYIGRLIIKEKLYLENQKLEANKFKRDSSLYVAKVIPESDLEKSHQSLIRINIELQQVRLDHSSKSIELAEKRQLLQDYRIYRIDEREKLISVLRESSLNLKAQLNIWKNNYLLVSPIKGIVSFTRFWTINQSVLKDEPVISVVPVEAGKFLGRINLKMQRSGKVKTGQLVNIKLSGYPYMEYGMVRGIVKSKSLVPSADAYIIEIDLPYGLTTLYGIKLDFTQNMQGTAEIITEDIRILQKIVNPFRFLISKNRR